MARTLRWRELKTGLIAFAVIAALALSVLMFARVGALHGDTSNIFVLTDDASGILNGTEVWLSGEKIGLVKDVHFRPVTTDTMQRLAIHTEVMSDRLHLIRRDAYADIRPGGNLIGSPVVFIASGTSAAPALRNGDTLVTRSTGAMKPVSDRVAALVRRLGALADTGARVVTLLNSQAGEVGSITRAGIPKIAGVTASISGIMTKATSGEGTLGLAARGDIAAHLARITSAKDSIMLLLSSGNGNVGRFRRDSTLFSAIGRVRDDIDSLRASYAGAGGITHARSDTALAAEIARVRAELTALMADIKKHRVRYLNF